MYDWDAKYKGVTRRTAVQIREQLDLIMVELRQRGPKTAEQLAASDVFNVQCRYLEKPLRLGLREKKLARAGKKRWTMYYTT